MCDYSLVVSAVRFAHSISAAVLVYYFKDDSVSSDSSASCSLIPFSAPRPDAYVAIVPHAPTLLDTTFGLRGFSVPMVASVLSGLVIFPP